VKNSHTNMSKQRKPAPKSSPRAAAAQAVVPTWDIPAFFQNKLLQSGLIFLLAVLLYANTLTHGFVLDDGIVITDNMFTQQGFKGIPGILSKDTFFGFFKVEGKDALVSGGRYRPMTVVLFAIIFELVGSRPFVFHLLTVLLFAATCVLLYRTLLLLFQDRSTGQTSASAGLMAWLAAILFTVHPIHTEVVANIKGCDEIVTLLACLGALWLTIKAFDHPTMIYRILAGTTFFLACLSKENAAAFVLLIPIAVYFFRKTTWSEAAKAAVPIFVAFVAFFILRGQILNWRFGGAPMELMNNPYLKIQGDRWVPYTFVEKFGTICYTLWKYVQLLVVPHPLTHDYYPRHIPQTSLGNPISLLGLVTYIGLLVYAVRGLNQRDPIRFGILVYLLALSIVSNVAFPIGTNMGERFAFMSSVGFCIVAAALLLKINNMRVALGVFGVAVALFSLKTIMRNPAWESNEKLFFTDVENSPNSAKIRNACGGSLFDKATKETDPVKQQDMCRQAMVHLNKAIELYPNYSDAFVSRGGVNYVLKNYEQAAADYGRSVQLSPENPKWAQYLALSLREAGKMAGEQRNDLAKALQYLGESWKVNQQDAETARLLGVANGVQGKHAEAIKWFTKATELAPQEAAYWHDLGQAYSASGDLVKGAELRQKAAQMNPKVGK
jgi:protein O-mannosyl-transferase